MATEWATTEPEFAPPKVRYNSGRRFYALAHELRANPGQWAKYPGNYTRNYDSARSIARAITQGRRATFPSGEFEAKVDTRHEIWVRYIGGGSGS